MRDRDPYEIAKVGIPVLAEAVAVIFAIGVAFVWLIILATPMPL